MPSREDARAAAEVGSIVGPAWSWRWQAPELAFVFGQRALRSAQARGDQFASLWARTLVVSASCRLGQQLAVVADAIDALRLAEQLAADDVGAILRVELAGCARSAAVPLVGAGLLQPVLSASDVRPAVRAAALIQLAGCLAYSERHRELDGALAEADQLYADDRELDQDTRLGLRAVLRSFVAREHRRRGDLRAALHAAEEGADLLAGLASRAADGGAGARVALQQVLGLLDLGWVDQACSVAAAALAGPVRAHSAAAIGWLALAVSTRVQLPAGLTGSAIALLREVTSIAERHRRDALHAESLTALSEAHELAGELAETLAQLRSAQVVRARRSRALRAARSALLGAFGEERHPEDLLRLLTPPPVPGRRRAARDGDSELLTQSGFWRALDGLTEPGTDSAGITLVLIDVARTGPGASASTVLGELSGLGSGAGDSLGVGSLGAGSAFGPGPVPDGVIRKVAGHLRDLTPVEAALARVGGAELAVLLPGTSRGQVERWAEELRAAMADVDWTQVTPGLTVNVRTVAAEHRRGATGSGSGSGAESAARSSTRSGMSPPASGVAIEALPGSALRGGGLVSPRLPVPSSAADESAPVMSADKRVPSARTPAEGEDTGRYASRGRGLPGFGVDEPDDPHRLEAQSRVTTSKPEDRRYTSGYLSLERPELTEGASQPVRQQQPREQESQTRTAHQGTPQRGASRWGAPEQGESKREEPPQAVPLAPTDLLASTSTTSAPARHGADSARRWAPRWVPAEDGSTTGRWLLSSTEVDQPAAEPSTVDKSARSEESRPSSRPGSRAAEFVSGFGSFGRSDRSEPDKSDKPGSSATVGSESRRAARRAAAEDDAADSPAPPRISPDFLSQSIVPGTISGYRDPRSLAGSSMTPLSSTPESGVASGGRRRRAAETAAETATETAASQEGATVGPRHSGLPADSARSVLDSLGITAGSGGRRRAPEAEETSPQPTATAPRVGRRRARDEDDDLPAFAEQLASTESESTGRRARRDYSQPVAEPAGQRTEQAELGQRGSEPRSSGPGGSAQGGSGQGDSERESSVVGGAESGSSFAALSAFSAMLARFGDQQGAPDQPAPGRSALESSEPTTTPLRPVASRPAAQQPFTPELMFGPRGTSVETQPPVETQLSGEAAPSVEAASARPPETLDSPGVVRHPVGTTTTETGQPTSDTPVSSEPSSERPGSSVESVQEPHPFLRPSPPPSRIAAKLSGPADSESESEIAALEGRTGRAGGRRSRANKLGDLLTEALRAYQDVRETDTAQDSLVQAGEPTELGATELGDWLGTGTEPIASAEPLSWRPSSSARSFGVSRHGNDESGQPRRHSPEA